MEIDLDGSQSMLRGSNLRLIDLPGVTNDGLGGAAGSLVGDDAMADDNEVAQGWTKRYKAVQEA